MGQISNQPAAQNMVQMEWDANLAKQAQDWANQCIYDHDPKNLDGKFKFNERSRDDNSCRRSLLLLNARN